MSSTTLYRASGLSLLLGALLGIIGNVVNDLVFSGNDPHQYPNGLWLATSLLGFIGSVLLVLGLPGIGARQAEKAGWLGLVGFVLTIVGGIMFTSFSAITFLVLPWLAVNAPKLAAGNGPPPAVFAYVLVAGLLFAVGGVLLGIATMRAGIFPRWAGLLIIIGAVLNLVDFPLNGIISGIVNAVAFAIFALGLAWIGYALISPTSAEATLPPGATEAAG